MLHCPQCLQNHSQIDILLLDIHPFHQLLLLGMGWGKNILGKGLKNDVLYQ